MYYRFIFVVEMIAAELIYMIGFERRSRFKLRLPLGILVALGIAGAMFYRIDNAFVSSVTFIGLFIVTLFIMWFCFDVNFSTLCFCCVAAYSTQHLAYQTANFISTLITQGRSVVLGIYSDISMITDKFNYETVMWIALYIFCFLAIYIGAYWFYARRIRDCRKITISNLPLFLIISIGILVDVIINAVLVYYNEETAFVLEIVVCLYSLACCVLMLSMLFEKVNSDKLKTELEFISEYTRKEKEQLTVSRDNIDAINIKCHDMKHQIRQIGEDKRLPAQVIEEMEQAINIYDTAIKTGNEVLDVILSEKNLFCFRHSITLSCVADGAQLAFMKDPDIYSLFGNALDNAIAAVMELSDEDKKVIGLRINKAAGAVSVNINNYFRGELEFNSRGLPISQKSDTHYHGFGMKSINYIVEKYGGRLDIKLNDDVFNLNILFPL